MKPNNGQIDSFLFNWAPTLALQRELLRLYRPFSHRFENQSDWLPRFHKAAELVSAPQATTVSLRVWMGISFALELMRNQESARGRRYDAVVLCRPDMVLSADMKISEYQLNDALFHTSGNFNTGDTFFLMSSVDAEHVSCIPRFFPSSSDYGGFKEHDSGFLPFLIPGITGHAFVDSENLTSVSTLFPKIRPSMMPSDNETWAKLIWPYHKLVENRPECGSQYDDYHRQRCESRVHSSAADRICMSLHQVSSSTPEYVDLGLTSTTNSPPLGVQSDFCFN